MRNLSRIMIAAVLCMAVAGAAMGGNKAAPQGITDRDRQKAEYVFLQAQSLKSSDSIAGYYDLVKYAYHLDSTNTAIAYHYGHLLLVKDGSSAAEQARGLGLMRRHVEAHPEDYYEATYYSDACMTLGEKELGLKAIEEQARLNPTKTEVQLRLASAYVRNKEYAKALATYETIEQFEGKSLETTAYKSALCTELGDTLGAIEQIRSLYRTAPTNVTYNLIMSEIMRRFSMSDSALYYLDRAQQIEPDNGNVYFAKAQYYDEIGDSVNFDKQIYNALVSADLDLDTKLDVLKQYTTTQLQRNDSTDRVNNLFRVLVTQHPHEAKVHELYGMYFSTVKNYAHAAEEIGYQLDLEPSNADAWQRLMVVNVLGSNYPAATVAAQKALEYNPGDLNLYRYIAPLYYQMKDYDKALATYDKALSLVDSVGAAELYSDLLGGKGDVMVELGDTLGAYALYDHALRIHPGNTGVMNNYAYFLSLGGKDLDRAESMAAKAVNANPTNSTFIDTYAWVFFKKGDYDMALFYMKSALANADGPSADMLEHYGDILYMTGDTDAAQEQWLKALELEPDNELLMRKIETGTYIEK